MLCGGGWERNSGELCNVSILLLLPVPLCRLQLSVSEEDEE
jgi:hypothetical protein